MLLDTLSINLPAIDLAWLIRILVYLILVGFVVFGAFMWREVTLGSRVLTTKATPLVRFLAAFLFCLILVLGAVVAILVWLA